jgi:RNA polymerase-interacting CarD/CdnL/TRCF family regulator
MQLKPMAKNKKKVSRELIRDYNMLDRMSSNLLEHQKNVRLIAKSIAKRVKSDLRYGLIENLDEVVEHMGRAQKELAKARKELEMI